MNFKQVIELYISGEKDGCSAGQGNLKIKNDVLIHYTTPILERYDSKYILNCTRYSIVTRRLQKQIKELIPEEQIIQVSRVLEGYKGSMKDFIKEKKTDE